MIIIALGDEKPKALGDYFSDWESAVFGFGYGTGEEHIVPALRHFLELCPDDDQSSTYDHREIAAALTPLVAWLFINILCKAQIIEYGTSPRFGWLTAKGRRLKAFVVSKTDDELLALTCHEQDYSVCYPDTCNCGPHGYEEGRICQNPFWMDPK